MCQVWHTDQMFREIQWFYPSGRSCKESWNAVISLCASLAFCAFQLNQCNFSSDHMYKDAPLLYYTLMLSRGWGKVAKSSVLNKGLLKKASFFSVLLMDTFVPRCNAQKKTEVPLTAAKTLKAMNGGETVPGTANKTRYIMTQKLFNRSLKDVKTTVRFMLWTFSLAVWSFGH